MRWQSNAWSGVRTHAAWRPVDLKSTPLTTRASKQLLQQISLTSFISLMLIWMKLRTSLCMHGFDTPAPSANKPSRSGLCKLRLQRGCFSNGRLQSDSCGVRTHADRSTRTWVWRLRPLGQTVLSTHAGILKNDTDFNGTESRQITKPQCQFLAIVTRPPNQHNSHWW